MVKLFVVIKSQEYISQADKLAVTDVSAVLQQERDTTPPISKKTTKESDDERKKLASESSSSTSNSKKLIVPPTMVIANAAGAVGGAANNKSKSQEPVSKPPVDMRRRRISNRSKSRSKSRSRSKSVEKVDKTERLERIRRSRSRDRNHRENQRDKNIRQYRNNSPPASSSSSRRFDHRKNNNDRISPKPYVRNTNNNQNNNSNNNNNNNNNINNSNSNTKRLRSNSPLRSRSNSLEYRRPSPKADNYFEKSKRCRDFDEKGYCMRGETCPWDHGVDPVVLEDINNPPMLLPGGAGGPMRPNAPIHSEYNPDAPDLWNRGGPGFGPSGPQMHLPVPAPRQPNFGFRGGPPFPFQLGPGSGPMPPRELISVPVMDPNHGGDPSMKRRFDPEDGVALADGPMKRKMPMSGRLGPRVMNHQQNMNQGPAQNCSLELRKIPRGLNAISHLNNHFSKFGKIVNIHISYDNDPEAAIVTFSTHAEANVAYRSTEAVLNNRFIKVFWHTGSGATGEGSMNNAGGTLPKPSELTFRKFPFPNANNPQASGTAAIAATGDSTNSNQAAAAGTINDQAPQLQSVAPKGSTTYINAASPAAQQSAIRENAIQLRLKNAKLTRATNEMIRKKQKEQQKEAVQLAHGLHKRKHDLLQEYLKQMRSAFDLVERTDYLDPQRAKQVEIIKELQVIIEKLRSEIHKDQATMQENLHSQSPPQRLTKEETQKALLDVELELISKEQHGDNDTFAIQKRYMELQKSLNRPHFAGPRTAPVARVPVQPARYGSTSFDRRPTSIQITGFVAEDSDAILGHFKVSSTLERETFN